MTTKKTKARENKPAKPDPTSLTVHRRSSEEVAEARAHAALRPTAQAALTLMEYNKAFGELAVNTLVDDLREQCEKVAGSDLARAEAMLIAQAHTLDAIFNNLARRAQRAEYLNQFDTNLRLALKAQSQCRSTLETLAVIKNPQPIAFVRQANIAHGPQQVNNGGVTDGSRAENSGNQPNKVLEYQHAERLDSRASSATSGTNSTMETVGAINRPENG